MRHARVNYVLVGGFVLAMLGGLIALLAVLAGRAGATHGYHTYYDNVAGLVFGTPVYFQGFQAGQVEAITPEAVGGRTRFRVAVSVSARLRIPAASRALITQPYLLSGRAISIEVDEGAARASTAVLDPGAEILAGDPQGLAQLPDVVGKGEMLIVQASVLLEELTVAMTRINAWLDRDFDRVVGEFAALPGALEGEIEALNGELKALAGDARAAIGRADRLLSEENLESVAVAVTNIRQATEQLAATSREIDALSREVRAAVGQVRDLVTDNKPDVEASVLALRHSLETVAERIDAVTYNLEGTSRNMYEFSRQVRMNPAVLLGGAAPRDEASAGR